MEAMLLRVSLIESTLKGCCSLSTYCIPLLPKWRTAPYRLGPAVPRPWVRELRLNTRMRLTEAPGEKRTRS